MPCCFAILPDDASAEEPPRPLAVFEDLQDALDWGARRYSGGAFRVRYLEMIAIGDARENNRAA